MKMKKIFFVYAVVCTLMYGMLLLGCATSQNTNIAGSSAVSLDGHWELPGGPIFFFEGRAFVAFYGEEDGEVANNGIIKTKTSSQLELCYNYQPEMDVRKWDITYKFLSNGNIQVSFLQDRDAPWINGIWKRRADLNTELAGKISANPVLGYWEKRDEQKIDIYHFYPGVSSLSAVGSRYGCSSEYLLDWNGRDIAIANVVFDAELPAERFQVSTRRGDSRSFSLFLSIMNYVIDDEDLLVGVIGGNMIAGIITDVNLIRYLRYTRYTNR